MKIACTVQYNGAAYQGFQIQKNGNTIQAELEKAVSTISRSTVRVHGAGRTDTGVHAYGMVVHFELEDDPADLNKFTYSLNSVLPKDISIIHSQPVSADFHARFSCNGREYVYRVINSPYRMAAFTGNAIWFRKPLDVKAMREASKALVGEHDFAAFTMAVYQKTGEKTVRRIDEIEIQEDGARIDFYYRGSGFLHNMIRIMTGTLIDVGKGELPIKRVNEILESKERVEAGLTLPPDGLHFLRALYDEYETPAELLTACLSKQ